jgi:hypothetical protein
MTKVGNEIIIALRDKNNKNSFIFKEVDSSNGYKNYFLPLLTISNNGNLINYYAKQSSSVEVVVDGYTLIPEVDYTLINLVLHEQIPSFILFKKALVNNTKVEVTFNDDNMIKSITKNDIYNGTTILNENDYNNFNIFLYNTYDKFVDGIKVPNIYENGLSSDIYSSEFEKREHEYVKFYLQDNSFVRFLITLFKLKIKTEDITIPRSEEGTVTKDNYFPRHTTNKNSIYLKDNTEGLLYLLFELVDTSINDNTDIVIDCNNVNQESMLEDIELDCNKSYSLPYIEKDIKINCNHDYNIQDYLTID